MKRILGVSLAALAVAACSESSVSPASPNLPVEASAAVIATGGVIVATSNSAGAGSFRDAVEQANADPSIQTIAFDPSVSTINATTPRSTGQRPAARRSPPRAAET